MTISINKNKLSEVEVLRQLPNKRCVCKAVWQGKRVVVKLFFGRRAKVYMNREVKAYQLSEKANIPMPDLLYSGKTDSEHAFVIIFQYIEKLCDINHIWHSDDRDALGGLLLRIQSVLVRQHQHDLLQKDIHPQNFILSESGVYVVDMGNVVCTQLSEEQCLKNVALLYAQLWVKNHDLIEIAFKKYCKDRHWPFSEGLYVQLKHYYQNQLNWRIKKTKQRVLRNSSEVVFSSTTRHCMAYKKSHEAASAFFQSPSKMLTVNDVVILKSGRTATVFCVKVENEQWIVKRYNRKSVWHYLKRCWRPSRAKRSWINAHILQLLGIPSVEPIAWLDQKQFGLTQISFFVYEALPGKLLSDYLIDVNLQQSQKMIVEQVVDIFDQLYFARILYGDMKSTNFIVTREGVRLIDLDDVKYKYCSFGFKKAFHKKLKRFMKNWEGNPDLLALFQEALKRREWFCGY